ncbi:hypothetical protein QR680_014335 [Steinernema hermaphroditum]|uniref:RanBD1 domain-containing protein n=1 Tax=Steinernema hermaphroditum TaxID=289476 RepID=A0AA39I8J3_9BILA|nr:hypothetical protein QR680_014335 [Steinernema hermaphroditum]
MSGEEKKSPSPPKEEPAKPSGLLKLRPSKIGGGALKSWEENKSSFKPAESTSSLSFTRPTLKLGSGLWAFGKDASKKDDESAAAGGVFGVRLESKLKTFQSISQDENKPVAEPSAKRKKSDTQQEEAPSSNSLGETKAKIEESIDELVKKQQKEEAERQAMLDKNAEPVSTGEEGERHIHNGCGKLYVFEWDTEKKAGSWTQRGPVTLRVNKNIETDQGRIICRAHGNQRVLINSAFFSMMTLKKENAKTLKFSANSGESAGSIRQFLFKASEKEIDALFKVMEAERDAVKPATSSPPRKRRASAVEDGSNALD